MGLERILEKISTGELRPKEALEKINQKQLELFEALATNSLTKEEVREEFQECCC